MGYGAYTFIVVIAAAVMASAVYALYWAVKSGQFREIEKGATSIFDDEEPIGTRTDSFPSKKGRAKLPGEPRHIGEASPFRGKPSA